MSRREEEIVMDDYKRRFDILFRYFREIEKSRPPMNEYIDRMSDLCLELLEAQHCIFWLYREEEGVIVSHPSKRIPSREIKAFDGIVGQVIRSGRHRLVRDQKSDPDYNPAIDALFGIDSRSSMYVPLKHSNDEVYGAIQVINSMDGKDFEDEELDLLIFVALYCEEAITSFFFEDELVQTQNDIVFLLAELGESRSKETAQHVRRVSFMTAKLAELIGLPYKDVYMIKSTSPLHDLGKVGIKDAILNKPGKLSEEEFCEMKQHTSIGHHILAPMQRKLLRMADIIALQHHERYDGTGYPEGLKGEEIHLFARITAVCDVFDALANKRVYKPAWDRERICEEFRAQRGRQFDPMLVDVFLQNIDAFYEILHEYPDEEDGISFTKY